MEKKRNKTMIGYEGIIQELITKNYNTSIMALWETLILKKYADRIGQQGKK